MALAADVKQTIIPPSSSPSPLPADAWVWGRQMLSEDYFPLLNKFTSK